MTVEENKRIQILEKESGAFRYTCEESNNSCSEYYKEFKNQCDESHINLDDKKITFYFVNHTITDCHKIINIVNKYSEFELYTFAGDILNHETTW